MTHGSTRIFLFSYAILHQFIQDTFYFSFVSFSFSTNPKRTQVSRLRSGPEDVGQQ